MRLELVFGCVVNGRCMMLVVELRVETVLPTVVRSVLTFCLASSFGCVLVRGSTVLLGLTSLEVVLVGLERSRLPNL